MSDVSEVKYAELHTRYREASMLADKYELIAKTHQDVNESLRKTNDDLRRMLLEKDEENAKLRELVKDMWPHVRHRSRMCAECELPCDTSDECLLYEPMRQRMRELGVEVDE